MPGTKDKTNSNTSTSRTITGPLPGVLPLTDKILQGTMKLGSGSVDPWVTQGVSRLGTTARNSLPGFNQQYGRIAALNRDGGLNDLQDQSVGEISKIGMGSGYHADQQRAVDLLNPIASGDPASNPYLDDLIKRMSEDAAGAVNMSAAGMGRYGSGAHQGAIADSVGDIAANLRYNDFTTQQGRKDAAIRDMFNMGTTGQGQKMSALDSMFQAGQQQRDNIIGGTKALKDAYDARQGVNADLIDAGQKRFDSRWDPIAKMLGVATGVGGLGSTSYTKGAGTQTQQGPSTLGAGLGGLLNGWTMAGPGGALLGGLGGAFF